MHCVNEIVHVHHEHLQIKLYASAVVILCSIQKYVSIVKSIGKNNLVANHTIVKLNPKAWEILNYF